MSVKQKQVGNLYAATVAEVGANATVKATEVVFVAERNGWYEVKATGAAVVDGARVLATGTAGLSAFIVEGAGAGIIASGATVAGFPDPTTVAGKFAILTALDPAQPQGRPGLWQSDGTDWVYLDVDSSSNGVGAAPTATDDIDKGYEIGDTWVDTSVTPRMAYICADNTAGAAIWVPISTVEAPIIFIGTWDPTTGAFPTPSAKGHMWIASADGTVDGIHFHQGSQVIALVDTASTTTFASNWTAIQGAGDGLSGLFIAAETTVAAFPDPTVHPGEFVILTAQDGASEIGVYSSNGMDWIWLNVDASHHNVIGADPVAANDADTGFLVGGIVINSVSGDAFVTTSDAAGAAVHRKITGGETAELLAVTATDVLAALSATPTNPATMSLNVNGVVESALFGSFTVVGTTVTWNPVDYHLDVSDKVSAVYQV